MAGRSRTKLTPYHEFLRLVYQMRKYQRLFFAGHLNESLQKSKEYERRVDAWLDAAGFEAKKIAEMRSLFEVAKSDPENVSRNDEEGLE